MFNKKLTKQQIFILVAAIILVITHIAIILAVVLSFRYYSIYPSLFGSIVAAIVCFLIVIDIIFFIGFNHQDSILKIVSIVLAVFMLAGGSIGTYFIAKANSVVNTVLDGNSSKYETYSGTFVCYNKYNTFKTLKDLSNKKVGFLTETTNGITYIAKEMMDNEKFDYATIYYKTNAELVQALIDGDIDAMVITSAYRDIYSLERDDNSPFAKYLDSFIDFCPFEKELKISSNKKTKNVSTDPFNVLLIGYSRTDIGSPVGLADSIILASINPQTYEVSMMSIARDSFVPIPCYGGEYDKINSGRSTSRQCFIDTVEEFVNTGRSESDRIDIDYYMELDYYGLVLIVDAIGGINVDNPVDFELDGTFVPAGKDVFCDGIMALQFCRERHHMPNGDFDRQQHQKEVIIKIAKKFIESGDISLALKAMERAAEYMSTDLTLNQLTSIFNLLLNTKNYTSLDTFDLVDFQTLRMTGEGGLKYYSYSMHLPLWVYLIYQGSFDESMHHIDEVMGNYSTIKQNASFDFSIRNKYVRPPLYSLSYPSVFMYSPDPMPAYWASLDGMTFDEAAAWASANGVTITIGATINPNSPDYDPNLEGRICDQSVRYGSLISEYKTCEVTIMGNSDIDLDDFYVPNFIGKDISNVLNWAYDHDIDVSGNEGITSGRVVVSQDPEAGTPIKDVDRIKVTLKEPEKYTITFDGNGGTVSETSRIVSQGSTYGSLPEKVSHPDGKSLIGWYTAATGGTEVTANTIVTGNATIYAHWGDTVMHNYIYYAEDGKTILDSGQFADGASVPSFRLTLPTKEGHEFGGWNSSTDENGNVSLTPIFNPITPEPPAPTDDPENPSGEEPENPSGDDPENPSGGDPENP